MNHKLDLRRVSFGSKESQFPESNAPTHFPFSCTVPAGHVSTHSPFESRKKPDRHAEHCTWSIVLATLKFGMPHVVHEDGHGVQSFALLSATNAVAPAFVLEVFEFAI